MKQDPAGQNETDQTGSGFETMVLRIVNISIRSC